MKHALALLFVISPAMCKAVEVKSRFDVTYATYGDRKVRLDLFSPEGIQGARPAVVVVHGGGWLKGDKSKMRPIALELAKRGYVTAAIEYRLAGEAKFPAAVNDCMAAVRWLRANHKSLHIDPRKIVAVGGSAGGHLVGLMATASHVAKLQGKGGNADQSSAIQSAVVMAGPMILDRGPVAQRSRKQPTRSNANKWFGKSVDEAPQLYKLASPQSHISSQSPPVLFQVGELDAPNRNQSMRTKLRKLKIATGLRVYKSGKHGCWNSKQYRALFVDDMDAFFRDTLRFDSVAHQQKKTAWGHIEFFRDRAVLALDRPANRGTIHLPRLNNRTKKVYPEGKPRQKLALRPGTKSWALRLPDSLNQSGTRIVVETIGQPVIGRSAMVATPLANGTIQLAAHQATVTGKKLRYEPQPHKNTVGYWTDPKDTCHWHFFVDKPGKYDVVVFQGCGKGHGGSTVAVLIGKRKLKFTVEDTGHFQNFKDRKIGTVTFEKSATVKLTLKPIKKARVAIMDVRRIRLIPAK